MKLLRYGSAGAEKPGLLDSDGQIRDLSVVLPDITATNLTPAGQAALKALDPKSLPVVSGSPRLGVPWTGIGKIICIGLNYRLHAEETNSPIPKEPIVFMKAITSLNGPNDDIVIPRDAEKTDWEVELGVVIGTKAQYVEEADALDYVAGYTIVNDVSERAFQLERGGTWTKGKSCDTFAPVGPWLVSADEVGDPQALDLWLDLNGERKQNSNTSDMIFNVRQIVSYLSRFMTLLPGDVIATGTPSGVGSGLKPQRFLKAGDKVKLGIARLGEQGQTAKAWSR